MTTLLKPRRSSRISHPSDNKVVACHLEHPDVLARKARPEVPDPALHIDVVTMPDGARMFRTVEVRWVKVETETRSGKTKLVDEARTRRSQLALIPDGMTMAQLRGAAYEARGSGQLWR
jgi:hypothetical protein